MPSSLIEIEQLIVFTVPHLTPPSTNHYKHPTWRHQRDGTPYLSFAVTKEAKAYRQAVALFARGRSVAPLTNSERNKTKYAVQVDVYLGRNQRLDADNAGKVALDSLQWAGVIHSDAYVTQCQLNIHKDERDRPRTEFTVERLEPK
jgi:Holliday junction resolvase RusA-like endonuclease